MRVPFSGPFDRAQRFDPARARRLPPELVGAPPLRNFVHVAPEVAQDTIGASCVKRVGWRQALGKPHRGAFYFIRRQRVHEIYFRNGVNCLFRKSSYTHPRHN